MHAWKYGSGKKAQKTANLKEELKYCTAKFEL